ncbi:MAG: hypothetical protein PHY64_10930 [Eubacteriales bacterium]|nr:hypothetical protein [Eubacteriales bacterium]
MQQRENERTWASSRRVMLVMMSLSSLYNYLYSMSVSSAYALPPILGGALFMSGAVAATYAQTFLGENRKYLARKMRVFGTALLVLMLLFSLTMFAIYPVFTSSPTVWALFAVVLALTMRAILGRRLVGNVMRGRIGRGGFIGLFASLQLIPAGIITILLYNSLPQTIAWQTLGGYGLSVLLECYTLWRERRVIAMERETEAIDPQTVEQIAGELHTVNAYSAYQRMHMLILMALQVTLVMVYTFIGITTGEIVVGLALTVGCTIILREATDFILTHLKRRKPAILQLLLIGLFLWIYGLVLFYRQLGVVPDLIRSYLTLGLCSSGLSISVTCLAQLEREMTEVAEYGLQNHMQGYDRIRAVYTELSILLGQVIALVLLAVLCMPGGLNWADIDFAVLLGSFRPLMVAPPLLLLVAAIVSVLHFPMNNRHFEKLRRFLTLTDEENPALKKQLDEVVVKKHKNRFGVKLIVLLLRPLYYHRVLGRENAAGYEEGSIVLVCNHGELYGPVVTNLYVPISFRPWCISSMMEKDVIVRYIYENTLVRQKWLPNRLKMPLTKLICPVCLWVFNSLEAIPVYRNSPRHLIKTFRLTIEAMQAGDNILVFPERGEAENPGEKGYASEGVGDLYTGFAMIAPAYYQKTHKRAVFLPIYASKRLRTLTFGKGIVYNPDAPATEEKLRIVNALQHSMEALYEQEERHLKHGHLRKAEPDRDHAPAEPEGDATVQAMDAGGSPHV